jgi:hypothetical protein
MKLNNGHMIRLFAMLVPVPQNLVDPFKIRGVGLHVEEGTFESSFPHTSSG